MDGQENYEIHEDDDDDDYYDSAYDVALEEDKGDADDITNEMEEMEARRRQEEKDRRYDHYKTMCDADALRAVDVLEPMEPINPSNSLGILEILKQGKSTRKERGATKGLSVSGPMHLKFDIHDRTMGDWRLKYGQQAGFCMRKQNICWNWKDTSKGTKQLMWEDTMVNSLLVSNFTNC